MFEKLKKKIGDTIVDGSMDSVKSKFEENRDEILETVLAVAVVGILIIGGVRLVTPPRAAVSKLHVYFHIA